MDSETRQIAVAHTDGSSINHTWGGWAVVLNGTQIFSGSGYGTNNFMEMSAVLHAIAAVPDGTELTVITDSRLVIGWLFHHWKAQDKILEICQAITILRQSKNVVLKFQKVAGHSGNTFNEMADKAAYREALAFKQQEENEEAQRLRGKGADYYRNYKPDLDQL